MTKNVRFCHQVVVLQGRVEMPIDVNWRSDFSYWAATVKGVLHDPQSGVDIAEGQGYKTKLERAASVPVQRAVSGSSSCQNS